MKISKRQLKKIIREEKRKLMEGGHMSDDAGKSMGASYGFQTRGAYDIRRGGGGLPPEPEEGWPAYYDGLSRADQMVYDDGYQAAVDSQGQPSGADGYKLAEDPVFAAGWATVAGGAAGPNWGGGMHESISKRQLKRIIREEKAKLVAENKLRSRIRRSIRK